MQVRSLYPCSVLPSYEYSSKTGRNSSTKHSVLKILQTSEQTRICPGCRFEGLRACSASSFCSSNHKELCMWIESFTGGGEATERESKHLLSRSTWGNRSHSVVGVISADSKIMILTRLISGLGPRRGRKLIANERLSNPEDGCCRGESGAAVH